MAKSAGAGKPAKLSRADKAALRSAKREKRRETWSNLKQAFTLTRQSDPRFLPYLIGSFVVAVAVVYVVALLISGSPRIPIPIALVVGAFVLMLVFSRRAHSSTLSHAAVTPGAA